MYTLHTICAITSCCVSNLGFCSSLIRFSGLLRWEKITNEKVNPFMPTVATFAVRETASLGIMGEPRVPPLNPSETIVLSEHYRV